MATQRYDQNRARADRARRKENRQQRQIDAEKYPNLVQFAKPLDYPVREIVGRDSERDQILSNLCRPELSNVMLLAPPGSGKALADNTMIPVADGRIYVPIASLKVGDKVYNDKGKPVEIEGVFPQGYKQAWEVTAPYGESIVCNDEHIWTVLDRSTNSVITKTLAELIDLGMYDEKREPRFCIPRAHSVLRPFNPFKKKDIPKLIGSKLLLKQLFSKPHSVLGMTEQLREIAIDNIAHRFTIDPHSRDEVKVVTHSYKYAKWLARLLNSSGHAACVDSKDPRRIIWAIKPPEWLPIEATQLDHEVEMTCIKIMSDDGLFQAGYGHMVTHNTALTQSVMLADPEREYFEIDPAKLVQNLRSSDEMGNRLKLLFDEAEEYAASEQRELVLFIDEFHQIVQMSEAAVEALKPVLADSGARGLRFIGATTFDEYNRWIRPNAPLDERLQRITLTPTDDARTVEILRGMAKKYDVADQFIDDVMFEQIVEITNRYQPSSVQPRKAIRVLDAMVGRYRYSGETMDMKMLADVISNATGMNLALKVDGSRIKKELDARVFGQDAATTVVSRRLQLVVADLHDKTRPQGSFLFSGSTGTGKHCTNDTPVAVYHEDGSVHIKNHGDLVVGDYVFDRQGQPTEVLGVFPQKKQDIYRVTLTDGRHLDVGGPHLWTVYTARQRSKKHAGYDVTPMTLTTEEIIDRGVVRTYEGDNRRHLKFFIPANGAVQWPEQYLDVEPYVLGALIGNGCLTFGTLTLSSNDDYVVNRVAQSFGVSYKKKNSDDYSWLFPTGEKYGAGDKLTQTADVLTGDAASLVGVKSGERRIPQRYLRASVQQRWELVRGLFDTDGSIGASNDRFNVSYSTFSRGLAEDVRELLFSLGISNSMNVWERTKTDTNGRIRTLTEYDIHVKVGNDDKAQFFSLPRKKDIAEQAVIDTNHRSRVKKFDMVGIASIEKLPEQQEATCIYVANDEHLYQAGQFIVTHNTELTKQIARLMFGDDRNRLIRFDMSEFSQEESINIFREELTNQVINQGHAVILLDEIEKAHRSILRLLLQVLDDGRLSDANGRQVSFLNTYVVMTTNAGSGIYQEINKYKVSDTGEAENLDDWIALIETALRDADFPPELLGRVDEITPFQPLSMNNQIKIVTGKLRKFRDEVKKKHNVRLSVHPDVITYLTEDLTSTDTDRGGARGSIRIMNKEVTTAVATFINENPNYKKIQIDMEGKLRAHNKTLRKTAAKPVIKVVD